MTEFQRALAGVQAIEEMVASLIASIKCSSTSDGVACIEFPFDPPRRQEPSGTGGEWVVVGHMSAFESQVTEEQQIQFDEVERRLVELKPIAERMQRKCEARMELEAAKACLHARLPAGTLPEGDQGVLRVLQDLVSDSDDSPAAEVLRQQADLSEILHRALELSSTSTYGVKMTEQVFELLAKLAAVQALFDTDVVPRLGCAVAALRADRAEKQLAEKQDAEAAWEAQQQHALEQARRPVEELLAACEKRLCEQRVAMQVANQHCLKQELVTAGASRCRAPCSLRANIYS